MSKENAPELTKKLSLLFMLAHQSSVDGDYDRAMDNYDKIIQYSINRDEIELQSFAIQAYYKKSIILVQTSRLKEAVECFDKSINCFNDAKDIAVTEWLALIMKDKAAALDYLDELEDSLATINEMLKKFENEADFILRITVIEVLINKGSVLHRLGRKEEAIKTFEEVITKSKKNKEPEFLQAIEITETMLKKIKSKQNLK